MLSVHRWFINSNSSVFLKVKLGPALSNCEYGRIVPVDGMVQFVTMFGGSRLNIAHASCSLILLITGRQVCPM